MNRYVMLFGGFAIIGIGVVLANVFHSVPLGFGIGMIGGALIGRS